MPLDQEPPDGDYAAYIDSLVNGKQGSPGAVGKPWPRSARRLTDTSQDEEHAVIRRDHNSHTEFEYVSSDGERGQADSLGPRGSPRLTGIVQIVLGLGALALFARIAIHMTYSHDPFSLDYIVPLVLLGFIARMFLARGNAKLREARSSRTKAGSGKTRRQRRAHQP